MKLSTLFNAYKPAEIDAICKELTGLTLNEKNLKEKDISTYWKYVGGNPSNGSVINMLKKGEKGLIERITNGIDAVIERKVSELGMGVPTSSAAVIQKAFPKFYENTKLVRQGKSTASRSYDAGGQVMVAVSDGSRSSRPTYDVVDQGTGIPGEKFPSTILSINRGNKLSVDKRYLIGAFGQGGSTSLSFAYATLIISKYNGKYYFTIAKQADLEELKNVAYVYLTDSQNVLEAEADEHDYEEEWIQKFISSESGTFIRMIDMNISPEISSLDAAKPRGLVDFINTELFDVGLPVNVYENRKNFRSNEHNQNRTSYGSALKLSTWSYLKSEYSGSFVIDFENNAYQIEYYAILPNDDADWPNDGKCKDVFEQINVYDDPIIYTVNGQSVCTEPFTRLKNNGLNQLKYRLLIVINLDRLGKQKYKFFTTDRSQIKVTDSSKGLLQEVIAKVCHEEKLIQLNSLIAGLALSKGLDDEEVSRLTSQVANIYSAYMKDGGLVKYTHPSGPAKSAEPKDYADHIVSLEAFCQKTKFYRDEEVTICLKTGAEKYVNEATKIDVFLDGKSNVQFIPSNYRGAIYYKCSASLIGVGEHEIQFSLYQSGNIQDSNSVRFEIANEKAPEKNPIKNYKVPNIEIQSNTSAELIIEIARIEEQNKIIVTYNNMHDLLYEQVYGKEAKEGDLKEVTDKYLKPLILFVLFMGEAYENVETAEAQNKIAVNFIKAQLTSFQN